MILDLTGSEQELINCVGCEIISGHLKPFGGILFKNENFFIAQDFELPIDGFIIISSVRHVEKYTELTENEQIDLTKIINKTLKILEDNNIAEEYNIIFEEKKGYHFHIWLMPRHKWMIEKYGKVIKNIKQIQDYSMRNLRTKENFDKIKRTCELLKRELNNERTY